MARIHPSPGYNLASETGVRGCQSCEHPNWSVRNPIVPIPVPTHFMSSVALDIFSLPREEWLGDIYDAIFLCVDRLSGWVIARPTRKLGLTAQRAAHLIMDNGLDYPQSLPATRDHNLWASGGARYVPDWESDKGIARLTARRSMAARKSQGKP